MPPQEFLALQEIARKLGGTLTREPTYSARDWNLIGANNPSELMPFTDEAGRAGVNVLVYSLPNYDDTAAACFQRVQYDKDLLELRRRAASYFLRRRGCTNFRLAYPEYWRGQDLWQAIALDNTLMLICFDTRYHGNQRDQLVLLGIYCLNDLGFNSIHSFHLWLKDDEDFYENPSELELFYKLHKRRLQYLEPHIYDEKA
jgi:hypothetical protein